MANWGSAEFEQLRQLQEKLSKFDPEEFCRACVKELAARLLALVIPATPVGVPPKLDGPKTIKVVGKSGKAKSFLTRNGAILSNYWSGYKGGTLRRGWGAKTAAEARTYANSLTVTKTGAEYSIEIINPVEYASYVEYGHRQTPGRYVPALGKRLKVGWVNGRYMLTISEQKLSAMTPAILEKKLNDLLKEAFGNG